VVDRLEAEDLARARWYSFFSRWFLAAPDQQAIDLFIRPGEGIRESSRRPASTVSPGSPPAPSPAVSLAAPGPAASPDSALEVAWRSFTQAVAGQSLAAMRAAYDDTFISVGEAPVSLHASVYLTGFANERPLAEVRRWLAEHGIQSSQAGLLTEDHLGLLCEAMAWLIIGAGDEAAAGGKEAAAGGKEASRREPFAEAEMAASTDASQQYLFERFIAPVCDEFCQRLKDAPDAGAYRELGQLFAAFSAVERQAFDIER
jgi:TorA maturation chaperone TorD